MNQILAISVWEIVADPIYTEKPWLKNLSLWSDISIGLTFLTLTLIFVYLLFRKTSIFVPKTLWLLAAFSCCCGVERILELPWYENWSYLGIVKLITALTGWLSAIALGLNLPVVKSLADSLILNGTDERLQENFLRSIYDNVREAIFVVNIEPDGVFRYQGFNAAAKQLTGVENVEHKTPSQILPPKAAEAVETRYRECVRLKTTLSYEECLPFQGRDTWWLTTLNPICNETGSVCCLIGVSLNISDRKQMEIELEEKQVFLDAMLDNLSDGIVACDEQGILALFNRASQDFFVLPQKPLPPEEWAEHYNLYDAEGKNYLKKEEIPLFKAFSGESFTDLEIMAIPPHGQTRVLLANGSPILDSKGNKLGAVVAVRDITERKQAEQALARLNAELEVRVKRRTAQLEQVNTLLLTTTNQLEKRNQELDSFAYVVSHDLKAPLRAIANLSEWIEEDLEDKLDEATRYNMNLLRNRVHRLNNLIDGLLSYSRAGRVTSNPETVAVDQMLAEIIDLLNVPSHIQIEIQQGMPTFVTELVPLQQIFNNLISNAIKHNDCDRGKITISVTEKDDCYEFSVADNGKGIDPQYHDRIFTIFQTLETKDNRENTGIGLAIVKKSVEDRGGNIWLKSQLGEGATFCFTWKK